MPTGLKGQKRPADVIGAAVHVMRVTTREIAETPNLGKEYARKGGVKGGAVRAKSLTPQRKREIASLAAKKRWGK